MTSTGALHRARVAITETREADLFGDLLRRRGAQVRHCPLVAIADAPDPAAVMAWVERFCAGCDDLILLTGEGLRRLLGCIERHRPSRRGEFLARLTAVRCIVRGPKPERVLRELGLRADLVVEPATTEGLTIAAAKLDLATHRVGLQLYGRSPRTELIDVLETVGATVDPVRPYVYAPASTDAEVLALIDELCGGQLDAIAFTSAPQVNRLFEVAAAAGRDTELRTALARGVVASIGPVVGRALREHDVRIDATPARNFALKPLAQALAAALEARRT